MILVLCAVLALLFSGRLATKSRVHAAKPKPSAYGRIDRARLLAADEHPAVLEGRWERDKLVLLSFPDEESCRRFIEAPEYQEISRDRRAGADTLSLLFRGIPS